MTNNEKNTLFLSKDREIYESAIITLCCIKIVAAAFFEQDYSSMNITHRTITRFYFTIRRYAFVIKREQLHGYGYNEIASTNYENLRIFSRLHRIEPTSRKEKRQRRDRSGKRC